MLVLYFGGIIVFAIIVIYCCIVRPIKGGSDYAKKEEAIHIGMTEKELYDKCGEPSKTVIINESCKLVSYTYDAWKGVFRGGSKHYEITATITDNKVTNVSKSD